MSDTPAPTAPQLPGGFAAISKYNPHLWTPDQLRAIFVARQRELADLTQALASMSPGEVGQHCLLVGARGMGKSTLLQRLALAVEDNTALHAAWLPLRFPEEQYTVNTLAQFWANVLDSLADALERRGLPTEAIDATAARLSALPIAEQATATLQAIRDISHQRGQRLLLLVDNTDLLLHNIGPKAQWALRQVLQSESQLLWVGGSYQSLEASSQYHDAFLDFFRVIELRPLTLAEMQEALLALANSFGGEAARSRLLGQLKAQPERLPTLRLLSGGNPRTTVMLYELLASGQAGHVRNDLEALLDSMTPLYKARLDALADLPRKLLAHILGHWAPMSLAQLAQASQVPKTSISPQLQRLELEGLIQKVKLHGTTRSGYQAAERFFNIWYLMRLSPRRQRTRLGWLVEFMRLWFSGELFAQAANQAEQNKEDHVILQSNLVLNNQQLAQVAMDRLVQQAEHGDSLPSVRLREMVWESHSLGLGERLADWMQQSPHAQYLQPMIQALYILAGAESKLQDLPAEVQQMADAVAAEAEKRLHRGDAETSKPTPQ